MFVAALLCAQYAHGGWMVSRGGLGPCTVFTWVNDQLHLELSGERVLSYGQWDGSL